MEDRSSFEQSIDSLNFVDVDVGSSDVVVCAEINFNYLVYLRPNLYLFIC